MISLLNHQETAAINKSKSKTQSTDKHIDLGARGTTGMWDFELLQIHVSLTVRSFIKR